MEGDGVGWFRRGDKVVRKPRNPYIRVSLRTVIDCFPFVVRYFFYWVRHVRKRDILYIDTFRPLCLKPIYGVSCGSIGSGGVGRTFRGGFCRFSLRPGLVEHNVAHVPADQFIVNVRRCGRTVYQQVLSCEPCRGKSLRSWSFGFPGERYFYRGLYPRSWATFLLPNLPLKLTCRQISPVLPHNYKDSCLPCSVFIWEVENSGDEAYSVSITFTFRNGTGDPRWAAEGECRALPFSQGQNQGISLHHSVDSMPVTYSLSTSSTHPLTTGTFPPSGDGRALWQSLLDSGKLEDVTCNDGPELGVAVSVSLGELSGGKSSSIEFALSWDMPLVHFPGRKRLFRRRYTRWFGSDGTAGPSLNSYALTHFPRWEKDISVWQDPIIMNPSLPRWYKSAIFNELYFMTDGGSVWFEFEETWKEEEPQMSDSTALVLKDIGRFGYLESWEYRMMNTYDVHFYASVVLAMLWPKLEESVQHEFADQVFAEQPVVTMFFFDGDRAPFKTKLRVPHDLGNPADEPWLVTNCYRMHNTGSWRDLNLKFILMTYRDALHVVEPGERRRFLEICWPKVQALIEVARDEWDPDGDGMIENSGTCDQTYDAWKMNGTSAYCGSLWLASLHAAGKMAAELGKDPEAELYTQLLLKAQQSYETKLWTGSYYKFDEKSLCHESVMADQLCGHWFVDLCEETSPHLSPEDRVSKSLKKIFELNVMGFAGGSMGAVNGMQPNGKPDRVCIQSEEVWTGVTYALASFMISKGMVAEGFKAAEGIYTSCFDRLGLHYQTPEALYEKRNYRAVGYMRPLAIWAIQWVLEKKYNFPRLPPDLFQTAQ